MLQKGGPLAGFLPQEDVVMLVYQYTMIRISCQWTETTVYWSLWSDIVKTQALKWSALFLYILH